ncbi:MAG: prolipoprotein diacylglyceryl transferase family protein [Chloroflexota bacterium]
MAGGVVGAWLFHIVDHLVNYAHDPLEILAIWNGGIAMYGGFIGGLGAGWIAAQRSRLPCWDLAESSGPAMLASQAIGKLGCLINGDA